MKLDHLLDSVRKHGGMFICTQIPDHTISKEVEFSHQFESPAALQREESIESLKDFYDTFTSLRLYHVPVSNEAAFYIAGPDQWAGLQSDFAPWLEDLDDEDRAELLPSWIDDCTVIGEIPSTGNYLLMPRSGEKRGFVFEFDHDGFEFIECAPDLEQFVLQLLQPSASALTSMASHMRFIVEDDHRSQWWISEMHDNRGNVIRTQV